MKLQFIIYFLPVLLTCACSDSSPESKQALNKIAAKNNTKNKPPSSFSDTVKIKVRSAVFFMPDSLQLQQIKTITDSAIFDAAMHDCFYQQRNAKAVLKKYYPDIKVTEIKNARYILFEKAGGETECIDLNKKNDPCGIFLFDGKKNPKQADMTNIESESGFYFSK